ncbi:efflux RND transporter periplasmic adaptor subunit [Paraferrimonas sp. SM1919]|uniref:efflux RND transporter periplasmic adaptor subunit n=1 Tax=Paraferrimonas sp. SM1919 TaxID=2662263 RepID=UPI0013D0BCF7|nr:efflux RND transporter periplasmic adaptor subunit [Paraferrimonas sp. SM1919]
MTIYRPLLTATAFLLGLSACSPSEEAAAPIQAPAIAVSAIEVNLGTIHPIYEFVGRTKAPEDADIRPLVSGRLVTKVVEAGSDVERGQLLFEIDSKPYQVKLTSAQAEVARAEAEKKQAFRTLERAKDLYKTKTLSEIDYEERQLAYTTATANLELAKSNLDQAQLELGWTQVHSPINGRVGEHKYSIGDVVSPQGEPLTTIVQLDVSQVNISVNEKTGLAEFQAEMLRGQKASDFDIFLKLSNGTRYPYKGEVGFVNNRVDPESGTITVRLDFPNPEKLLLPGQYVNVEVEDKSVTTLVIPSRAVQYDQTGQFVMIINKDNQIEQRYVTLFQQVGEQYLVSNGLAAGERIVVDGLQRIRVGATVEAQLVTE